MKKIPHRDTILAITLALLVMDQAYCADLPAAKPALNVPHRHARRHVIALPPEHHVVEVVEHAHGNRMIVNDQWFTASSVGCGGWIAGDRVVFTQGSDRACVETIIRNVSRHQTCELRCEGPAYHW